MNISTLCNVLGFRSESELKEIIGSFQLRQMSAVRWVDLHLLNSKMNILFNPFVFVVVFDDDDDDDDNNNEEEEEEEEYYS
jgi:hypothetical protein